MPATCSKKAGTGATKDSRRQKVEECLKNTCLEHSTGNQVHWKQVSVMIGYKEASPKGSVIHKQQGSPLWEQLREHSPTVYEQLYVPFSINGAFTDVLVTHAMGTNSPPHHHRCWLLTTIRMSLHFQKQFECGLIWPQRTLHGRVLTCTCRCSDELC